MNSTVVSSYSRSVSKDQSVEEIKQDLYNEAIEVGGITGEELKTEYLVHEGARTIVELQITNYEF